MKRIIVQFQFKSGYQTGILTYKGDGFNEVKVRLYYHHKLPWWLTGFFPPQVPFINIYFIREWAGSGRRVKNEATPQKINKILYASICFWLGTPHNR